MPQYRKCFFTERLCKNESRKLWLQITMAEETREVRGRLPKSLKIAFEIACARLEVTQTAALEEAIKDWLQKKESSEKQQ
ncbi:hypothetical protein [Nostoc sp.]|uniref:hypothetical protein n=1 Tax=Nostoc sp. TaxID=1180 RepID=UPI002FF9A1F5